MTASVSIANATKRFDGVTALDDVSLEIDAGDYVVLLGPSGCGKTTLLFALGGFHNLTAGRIEIDGRDMTGVPPAARPTTTMFQDYALFPHLSVADNVGFGLRMRGLGRNERLSKASALLELVGLAGAASRRPHELSGGQRQRVALARALAVDPDVLLLDEPLGALDLKLRRQMQDELKAIQEKIGTTFVHVTHDQEEAMAIADRIVVMNDGRIEDAGTPERIYRRPRTRFAASFVGDINILNVRTTGGGLETPLGPVPMGGPATALGIRPEAFREQSGGPGISLGTAEVMDEAFFGTHYRCHLKPGKAPDMILTAHLPLAVQPKAGDIVELHVDLDQLIPLP